VSEMLPPDMMSMIGGGGGFPAGGAPPPPPGGGMPPDMAAMMQAPPPPEGALHGGSAAEGDPNSLVAEAIDLLEQAAKAQPSDQIIQTYLQCIAKLQATLATTEKAQQAGEIAPQLASETAY
jgi:hypothetical protein